MSDGKEMKHFYLEKMVGNTYAVYEEKVDGLDDDAIDVVLASDHDQIVAKEQAISRDLFDRMILLIENNRELKFNCSELRAEVECKRLAKDQAIAAHNKIVTEYNEQRENIIELIKKIADVKTERDELRAEVERLKHAIKQEIQNNDEFGCEFVYIVMAKETIARQAREAEVSKAVIEIAKRVLHNAGLRPPDGGTPTVETICEDLNDAIKKIAAIEQAEGEKEHEETSK